MLRNTLTGEAIRELQLPAPTSFQPHTLSFTPSGDIMFVGKNIFLPTMLYNLFCPTGIIDDESYLQLFQLNQVQSLQHCWEEEFSQKASSTQSHTGQTELLTDLLENYLTARSDATPERLLRSQQRWKELSTEVAVISKLKKQTRNSQLIRAFVSHIVMGTYIIIYNF